jgi:thiosulfate/3-mercaptopyruvate sulfurtransferase
MPHDLLISAEQLQTLLASNTPVRVFDCTFDLSNPSAGHQQFAQSHILGAVYADLDKSLSDKIGTGASGGRHPLPQRQVFAAWLSTVGLANDMQAVVYDRNAANYSGRLWWMLKWLGHAKACVLDGGLQAWISSGGIVSDAAEPAYSQTNFSLAPALVDLVATQTVANNLGRPAQTLIDARGVARFRGEVEPMDPVAGHIPGALNRPFSENMASDGKFKSANVLRAEFDALLAGRDPASVVHSCGSGVSAIPNLLAMRIAGLGSSGLYAGSWSDWCSDSTRPMAQG